MEVSHQHYVQNSPSIKKPRKCSHSLPLHTLNTFEDNAKPGGVVGRQMGVMPFRGASKGWRNEKTGAYVSYKGFIPTWM